MIKGKHKVNQMVNKGKHAARSQGRVNGKPPPKGFTFTFTVPG